MTSKLGRLFVAALLIGCGGGDGAPLGFEVVEVAHDARHAIPDGLPQTRHETFVLTGGLAAVDVDRDGAVDLFVTGGVAPSRMLRNRGDGSFDDVTAAYGLDALVQPTNGATFADYDGDGDLDLFVGHVHAARALTLMRNDAGVFVDVTEAAGLLLPEDTVFSTALGDIDADGDLDLFVTYWLHWSVMDPRPSRHLWCNQGDGTFADCSAGSGITGWFEMDTDHSFTATFSDLDEDGRPDLLVASDFGRSAYFRANGPGTFEFVRGGGQLGIECGMGAVVADFNGDHHFDWFVTAIELPTAPIDTDGNRLLLGDGQAGAPRRDRRHRSEVRRLGVGGVRRRLRPRRRRRPVPRQRLRRAR